MVLRTMDGSRRRFAGQCGERLSEATTIVRGVVPLRRRKQTSVHFIRVHGEVFPQTFADLFHFSDVGTRVCERLRFFRTSRLHVVAHVSFTYVKVFVVRVYTQPQIFIVVMTETLKNYALATTVHDSKC